MSFKGITVNDFIELRRIAEDNQGNPVRQQIKTLAYVLGRSEDEIGELSYKKVKELSKKYSWAYGYPDAPIKKSFRFKGRRFKAILDARDIKAGQFIDSTELSQGTELEMLERLPILCGVLLQETTRFKKHLKDKDKFKLVEQMPINYVYPNIVFFCKVYTALLPSIAHYLKETGEQILAQHGLSSDTDGE